MGETDSFLGNHIPGWVLYSLNLKHPLPTELRVDPSIPQLCGKMRHSSVLSTCLGGDLVIVMGVTQRMVLEYLTWSQDLASALHTSALGRIDYTQHPSPNF